MTFLATYYVGIRICLNCLVQVEDEQNVGLHHVRSLWRLRSRFTHAYKRRNSMSLQSLMLIYIYLIKEQYRVITVQNCVVLKKVPKVTYN